MFILNLLTRQKINTHTHIHTHKRPHPLGSDIHYCVALMSPFSQELLPDRMSAVGLLRQPTPGSREGIMGARPKLPLRAFLS